MKYQSVIVNWLIKKGAVSAEDRELYEYALTSAVMLISPLLLSLVIAAIMGVSLNGLILVIPFMTIRKYSGGFHSKRLVTCIIESTILITVMIYITKVIDLNEVLYILLLAGSIELCICSPVKSENKDISEAESEKYKRIVQIQIAFYVALSLILILFGIKRIAICLICGVLLPAILQLPCVIKDNILDKVSRKS